MTNQRKREWQKQVRAKFVKQNGFSQASDYATGKLRAAVLKRDGYRCVTCGMTAAEHRAIWGRPITVDHRDRNRKRNVMRNLQTLCLRCHGRKDIIPKLTKAKGPKFKTEILEMRADGCTYREIAFIVGLAAATVYRWDAIWKKGKTQ